MGYPYGIEEECPKPRAAVPLAGREEDREWPPLAIAHSMYLGTLVDSPLRLHPSASSSSLKSLFAPSLPSRFLVPATPREVLMGAAYRVSSTPASHPTSPTASLLVCACSSNRSRVPSRLQRLQRSKQVCQGP